jgi:pimeloyl-ACP methyl ester carboxylesterase
MPGFLFGTSVVSKSGSQSLSVTLDELLRYGDFAEHGQSLSINGATIYYETYGEGEPLLLLHGNNESITSFRYQIDELKKNYKVIAVDSRGQGKSTMDKQKLNYELMASDMNVLLDKLKIDSVNILGWSDGGNTGLVMAIKYPSKVRSLIAMGANLYPNKNAVQKKFMHDYRWTIRLVRVLVVFQPHKWKAKLRVGTMVLRYPRMKPTELKNIKAPVLVLAGEKDVINESHTKLIAANIKNSKLTILKGLTHYAPQDDPGYFNREVESFLKVNSRAGTE